jgi:hypothetical protein
VKDTESHSQRARTRSRAAHKRKAKPPVVLTELRDRLALNPRESGAAIGKSATYIYRQFYAGRLKPIQNSGRLMVSRVELDRFLAQSAEYNPKSKSKPQLKPEAQGEEVVKPS